MERGHDRSGTPPTGDPHRGEDPREDPPPEGRATQGTHTEHTQTKLTICEADHPPPSLWLTLRAPSAARGALTGLAAAELTIRLPLCRYTSTYSACTGQLEGAWLGWQRGTRHIYPADSLTTHLDV